MAVMDEFKEQRELIKNGTSKQKLIYFWDYYKWYVIIPIVAVILLFSLIHHIVTQKDNAFYAVLLNAAVITEDLQHASTFTDYAGIDTDEYETYFDTSIQIHSDSGSEADYTSMEKLMIYTATGDLDVMVTDMGSFQLYANNSSFYDLRDILSEDQIAKYEHLFYYVDQKIVDELQAASDNLDASYVPVYPDPGKPEEMETPIPVGINVGTCQSLITDYNFWGEDVMIGVYANTNHLETALKYIDFLLEEVE